MTIRLSIIASCLLGILLSARPGICTNVNKADYIKSMDSLCSEYRKKGEAALREFNQFITTDPKKASVLFDKIVRDAKEQDRELTSVQRPQKGEAALGAFFELKKQGQTLLERINTHIKTLVARKQPKDISLPNEMAGFSVELNENAKKTDKKSKEYGFKRCGLIDPTP